MKRVKSFWNRNVVIVFGVLLAIIHLSDQFSQPSSKRTAYPNVHFKTQNGSDFALQSARSKYTIAAFFFTGCPTICPRMTTQMKRVQAVISISSNYCILFYSINPKGDTPQKLLDYARKHHINSEHWLLLTGSADGLKAASSFYALRGEADSNDPGSFIHDGHFLLTNNETGATTRYLGTDSSSVDQLIKVVQSDL